MHADIPFTALSQSALLVSPTDRMSCPSLQKRRMHVFIGDRTRRHAPLSYYGSEKSYRQTSKATRLPIPLAAAMRELL